MSLRPPAVAGTWYPGNDTALTAAVDRYLGGVVDSPRLKRLTAIIAPHAGLMYSGPVAAHAYQQLRDRDVETVVLVGPSHYVAFEGVSIYPRGGFDSPLGAASIDESCASALLDRYPVIREYPQAHVREHSLEMQLPFIRRLLPNARIVPLVMGAQTASAARALGDALGAVLEGRNAVMVASTDLSHFESATRAAALDAIVIEQVRRFDPDGLQRALDVYPHHACGGGPTVAVMRAALILGARDAVILQYADSGDVSGDKSSVVGYLAAALGTVRVDERELP